MRTKHALLALLLLTGAAGCGKEVLVGGQKDVETRATGDGTPEGGSPSRAAAYALAPGGPATTHIAGRAQGTITFDARVELVSATGAAEDAGGPASATVRIDGHDSVFVARGSVPGDQYATVRVTFTRVTASVTSGLVIGGIDVTGVVNVSILPGSSIVVERQVDLGGPDEDVDLLVDLDASAWLGATNPATRIVAAAAFQSAVKVKRL
ncbi:MAG TPA: hypothetical protein VF746_30145 [Longimicrobium sp.]